MTSLDGLVGQSVREWRLSLGWTQDEVARRMQTEGATSYTRGVVAALENGGKRVDLSDAIAISLALQVSLRELLESHVAARKNEEINVKEQLRLRASDVVTLLFEEGSEPAAVTRDLLPWPAARSEITGSVAFARRETPGTLAIGELERRVARRIGVTPDEVMKYAVSLWGRSMTAERDERARDRPSAKQHVSRGLVKELEAEMKRSSRTRGKR